MHVFFFFLLFIFFVPLAVEAQSDNHPALEVGSTTEGVAFGACACLQGRCTVDIHVVPDTTSVRMCCSSARRCSRGPPRPPCTPTNQTCRTQNSYVTNYKHEIRVFVGSLAECKVGAAEWSKKNMPQVIRYLTEWMSMDTEDV